MNKRHYYCALGKPAPIEIISTLIECAEKQGWIADHVLFYGHGVVSSLSLKQQSAVPLYTIIFSKWGELDKIPALPNLDMKPGNGKIIDGSLPSEAASDPEIPNRPPMSIFKKENPDEKTP